MFMLVDMFMLCSVSFGLRSDVGDRGPSQLRTSVRCRGQGPSQPGLRSDAVGKAQYVLICYYVVCGSLGELTKLRAYSFSFGFRYSAFKRGAREDCRAHTIVS